MQLIKEKLRKTKDVESPIKLKNVSNIEKIGSKFDSLKLALVQDSYMVEYSKVSLPTQVGLSPK